MATTLLGLLLATGCKGQPPSNEDVASPDADTQGTDNPADDPMPRSTPTAVSQADGRSAPTPAPEPGLGGTSDARVGALADAPANVGDVAVDTSLGFFVTSVGAVDTGGNFGGLEGADAKCQRLATAVGAGARTWRAYLGVAVNGKNPINAKDRIGKGPWFNAKGQMVAPDLATLHGTGTGIATASIVDEHGARVPSREGGIITGSMHNGNVFPLRNCNGWTLNQLGTANRYAFARLGHANDSNPTHWNDAQGTDCSPTTWTNASQSSGRIYCFAAD